MLTKSFLVIFLFLFSTHFALPCFSPPQDWEIAAPQNHSPFIQIAFLGKNKTSFRPRLNLAIEDIDVSAKQYLKAVKEIHEKQPNTSWRDLGAFKTKAGSGRLTEINTKTPIGNLRMLQMIIVKGSKAYIMTGSSLKDEFIDNQPYFIESFQSLSLLDNLFDPLSEEKKQKINDLFSHLGSEEKDLEWNNLQKMITEEYQEMGNYWHFLVLKEGYQKIFTE